jgi:hypothetical protein
VTSAEVRQRNKAKDIVAVGGWLIVLSGNGAVM